LKIKKYNPHTIEELTGLSIDEIERYTLKINQKIN